MIDYLGYRYIAELLFLPPTNLLVLAFLGLLLWRRRPRLAATLWGITAALLLLLSTPVVAAFLIGGLEGRPLDPARIAGRSDAAIVVLSGDLAAGAPEYGGTTIGSYTLVRMRYGARLHRETGLPLLVTGGVLRPGTRPVAYLMRDSFARDFGIAVRWVEPRSRTTFENARYSAEILRADGIRTAVVVTHAWHMPRALEAFAAAGMDAIAAPTGFAASFEHIGLRAFLPRPSALVDSHHALHEWVGRAWYLVLGHVTPAANGLASGS